MEKKSIFKDILGAGRLIISYSLLRAIGAMNTIVFSRILTEYLYAINHETLIKESFFAINIKDIAKCLNFSTDDVEKSIKDLENYDFINILKIDEFYLLHIDEDSVINFVDEHYGKNWDYNLFVTQGRASSFFKDNEEKNNLIPNEIESSLCDIALDENGNPLRF